MGIDPEPGAPETSTQSFRLWCRPQSCYNLMTWRTYRTLPLLVGERHGSHPLVGVWGTVYVKCSTCAIYKYKGHGYLCMYAWDEYAHGFATPRTLAHTPPKGVWPVHESLPSTVVGAHDVRGRGGTQPTWGEESPACHVGSETVSGRTESEPHERQWIIGVPRPSSSPHHKEGLP